MYIKQTNKSARIQITMLRNIRGREHTIEVLNWNIENLEALRQIIKCNEAGKIDSFQIEAQGQLRLVKVKGQDE